MNPSVPESTLKVSERMCGAEISIWRTASSPEMSNSRRSVSLSVTSTRLSRGERKKMRAPLHESSSLR